MLFFSSTARQKNAIQDQGSQIHVMLLKPTAYISKKRADKSTDCMTPSRKHWKGSILQPSSKNLSPFTDTKKISWCTKKKWKKTLFCIYSLHQESHNLFTSPSISAIPTPLRQLKFDGSFLPCWVLTRRNELVSEKTHQALTKSLKPSPFRAWKNLIA